MTRFAAVHSADMTDSNDLPELWNTDRLVEYVGPDLLTWWVVTGVTKGLLMERRRSVVPGTTEPRQILTPLVTYSQIDPRKQKEASSSSLAELRERLGALSGPISATQGRSQALVDSPHLLRARQADMVSEAIDVDGADLFD